MNGEQIKNFIKDTHAQSLLWWKIETTMKGFFLLLSIVLFFAGISSHGIYLFFIYFILFATLITKNIGKEEEKKKKWRGDVTETIGAYERLGLLEL